MYGFTQVVKRRVRGATLALPVAVSGAVNWCCKSGNIFIVGVSARAFIILLRTQKRTVLHAVLSLPYTDSHASCSLGGSYLSSHFASRLRLSFPASIMSSVRLSLGSSLLGFVSPWVCLSLLVRALCPRPLQPYTAAIHICSHVAGLLSRLLLGVKGCQRASATRS